jgi:plasmid maintenance system antidote protein VapI
MLTDPNYKPDNLLDRLQDSLGLKNDAALAQALDVSPVAISKLRTKSLPLGPVLLVNMADLTNKSIAALRELAGLSPRMYIKA